MAPNPRLGKFDLHFTISTEEGAEVIATYHHMDIPPDSVDVVFGEDRWEITLNPHRIRKDVEDILVSFFYHPLKAGTIELICELVEEVEKDPYQYVKKHIMGSERTPACTYRSIP